MISKWIQFSSTLNVEFSQIKINKFQTNPVAAFDLATFELPGRRTSVRSVPSDPSDPLERRLSQVIQTWRQPFQTSEFASPLQIHRHWHKCNRAFAPVERVALKRKICRNRKPIVEYWIGHKFDYIEYPFFKSWLNGCARLAHRTIR